LVFLGLWRCVRPQRLPSFLQGRPLHRSIDSACVLEKNGNEKHAYFHKSWGKIKGRKIKLLKHVFVLYNLPVIFSKIFSLATLARLRKFAFYTLLKQCKHAMCFANPIYIFFIFGVIIPECKFPKFTENTHKIAKNFV